MSIWIYFFTIQYILTFVYAEVLHLHAPDVKPVVEDEYICYSVPVLDSRKYITEIKPIVKNKPNIHHMIIYGCSRPGSAAKIWSCSGMQVRGSQLKEAPICETNEEIIYSWGMDTHKFSFPADSSFPVGKETDIRYLILQLHYKNMKEFKQKDKSDASGFDLIYTHSPTPLLIGVYILGTDGSLPPRSTVFEETACEYDGKIPIKPFAFRVHAHSHGRLNVGYVVRDQQWIELGRISPQKPQVFYNTTNSIIVEPGDYLASRCVMVNPSNELIKMGQTQKDEMCNFYIMYMYQNKYAEYRPSGYENLCYSHGWPRFHWSDYQLLIGDPPLEAQTSTDGKEIFEESEFVY